jgi:ribonuclease HII
MSAVTEKLYQFDREHLNSQTIVLVGIDEAGRGPLAGPVAAAAVILDLSDVIPGLNDSKQVPAKRREALYDIITKKSKAWACAIVDSDVIDTINILQATFRAMKQALDQIAVPWSLVLVDGNQMIPTVSPQNQQTVVGGDAKSASIAAASIIAKVTRDRIMQKYHIQYPQYAFDEHKGYGTDRHCKLILQHGLCAIHRKTFCERLLSQTALDLD